MLVGKLDIHMQKNEVGPYLTLYKKIKMALAHVAQ